MLVFLETIIKISWFGVANLVILTLKTIPSWSALFKIWSETCRTEAQFCQNLYMIKKETLPDRPKFCQSGSAVRHLFWRLDQYSCGFLFRFRAWYCVVLISFFSSKYMFYIIFPLRPLKTRPSWQSEDLNVRSCEWHQYDLLFTFQIWVDTTYRRNTATWQ